MGKDIGVGHADEQRHLAKHLAAYPVSPHPWSCHRRVLLTPGLVLNLSFPPSPGVSQEAKPYKNDPEIVAMTNLLSGEREDQALGIDPLRNSVWE
eukprot:scaffold32254_cov152-Isochrysis_galbana.AAC.1